MKVAAICLRFSTVQMGLGGEAGFFMDQHARSDLSKSAVYDSVQMQCPLEGSRDD